MALVRFPDGVVKVTEYHGTSDILHAYLADSYDEWKRDHTWEGHSDADDAEPVEIFAFYGGEWWWEGRATRQFVVAGIAPYGAEDQMGQVMIAPAEQHEGKPQWVEEWERANR